MSDVLHRILDDKREHVALCRRQRPLGRLEKLIAAGGPVRSFRGALEASIADRGLSLIAEIKRASPSRGLIRADFDPAQLARAYAIGGADCLSVLTDVPYFQGADANLSIAREAAELPVLRKDFMIDPYQVVEARALGADCILVIMAAVDDDLASELVATATDLGMDALVEVHDDAELDRAIALPASLLGINNRNLKSLTVDLAVTERLAPRVPPSWRIVAESGLYGHADLQRMTAVGARAFLVGESLMRQDDVAAATRDLLAGPA
ncbi:MAG: indole-3-glycerol phosphate synthase TrpC [Pseudomonadota bacterium]